MVVPLGGRSVAAVAGGLLVVTAWASVIGTVRVPRPVSSWLTRWVDQIVTRVFWLVTSVIADDRRRDRVLAAQAATILLGQLAAWLGISFLGFGLLLWPFAVGGITSAFTIAGSSMFTLGFAAPAGAVPAAIVFAAALTGLVVITLPNRLPAGPVRGVQPQRNRGGAAEPASIPSWGPEPAGAHPRYALGSGVSTIDTLPDLYAQWERWAADVGERAPTSRWCGSSRSPRPLSSSVTALLAVLTRRAVPGAVHRIPRRSSAAPVPARGVLVLQPDGARGRCACRVYPESPTPGRGIGLSYQEHSWRRDQPDAQGQLSHERDPAEASRSISSADGSDTAGRLRAGRRRQHRAGPVARPPPAGRAAVAPSATARRRHFQINRLPGRPW